MHLVLQYLGDFPWLCGCSWGARVLKLGLELCPGKRGAGSELVRSQTKP